mgnify:CR=1 FL=1
MGRIKTLQIKRIGHELMRLCSDKFTDNYEQNKGVINNLITTPSKKLRNIITGYVTRLVKQSKEPKKAYMPQENIESFYK